MLLSLNIRDYVIVDQLELSFSQGFTALTGETGAGKSILIDALSLSLGSRSESGLTRKGSEKSEIISEFDISKNSIAIDWLKINDLFEDETLFLRRIIFPDGRSKGFINSIPCPISKLKEVGDILIDIYSQNSFHSLIQPTTQLDILDHYAQATELVKKTQELYVEWKILKKKKEEFEKNKLNIEQEFEYLKLLIKDYEQLNFSFLNWELIQEEHKKLTNAKELIFTIQKCNNLISEDDISINKLLKEIRRDLTTAYEVDKGLKNDSELLDDVLIKLNELERNLNHYLSQFSDDEGRVIELETHIQSIFDFSRKYSIQPENFESEYKLWQERFNELSNAFEDNQFDLHEKLAFQNYYESATQLSKQRIDKAKLLADKITSFLNQLSFSNAELQIDISQVEPQLSGIDQVVFHIRTFKGADLAPISKVASGGELSRISLAIRVASAENTNVPVMIFDEVDVGIGGGVAEIVGKLLKQLGSFYQVFSITHLAQVASKADHHFKVYKDEKAESVISKITLLNDQERIQETARMIGGIEITATTLEHAKEMLH
jgi:DNA repair protein RecN (Recombination protein N)